MPSCIDSPNRRSEPVGISSRTRLALTLVEVAISAALLTIGILALALFVPGALKAQQQARFKLYAAIQAMDMVEAFANAPAIQAETPVEAAKPWDAQTGYAAYMPDLEQKLASPSFGIAPVPTDIANRLDSENGLIQRVLANGGRLYFANPRGAAEMQMQNVLRARPPSDAQKIVFAVVGLPQQNAVPTMPMQAWPQYIPYPSAPLAVTGVGGHLFCWEAKADIDVNAVWNHDFANADGNTGSGALWYGGGWKMDSGVPTVGDGTWMGFDAWMYGGDRAIARMLSPGWLQAKYYVALALWYAAQKNVPVEFIKGNPTTAQIATAGKDPDQVRAMRFLAHAGMCMTKHFALDPQIGQPAHNELMKPTNPLSAFDWFESIDHPGLRAGVPIPGTDTRGGAPVAVPGRVGAPPASLAALYAMSGVDGPLAVPAPIPAYVTALGDASGTNAIVSHASIVHWHEISLRLAMAAANDPYDWRTPRPLNRAICTDFPLTEWDVCTAPRSGAIAGTASDPNMPATAGVANQWWAIAGGTLKGGLTGDGRMLSWAGSEAGGNPAHYTLGAPFEAAERTRLLVFWAVDWTEYNDFETAPSAQVDASRYLTVPPIPPLGLSPYPSPTFTNEIMSRVQSRWGQGRNTAYDGTDKAGMTLWWYDQFQPSSRNPEKAWLFIRPVNTTLAGQCDLMASGAGILPLTCGPDYEQLQSGQAHAYIHARCDGAFGDAWGFPADQGWASTYGDGSPCPAYPDGKTRWNGRLIFSGCFGGDRNGDRMMTRGPLAKSIRLKAVEVGRFAYYDPRLSLNLR